MQMSEITIRLPVDDGITPRDIRSVVANQLHFLLAAFEFGGGNVHPEKASVDVNHSQLPPGFRI